LCFKY